MPTSSDLIDNESLTRLTSADLVSPDVNSGTDQADAFDQMATKPEEMPVFNSDNWKDFFDGFPLDTRLDITGQSKDIIQMAVGSDILASQDLSGIRPENLLVQTAEKILGPDALVQSIGFLGAPETVPNYLNRIQTAAESAGKRGELLMSIDNAIKSVGSTAAA